MDMHRQFYQGEPPAGAQRDSTNSIYHIMKNCVTQGPQWLQKSKSCFHPRNNQKERGKYEIGKCRLHLSPWSGNILLELISKKERNQISHHCFTRVKRTWPHCLLSIWKKPPNICLRGEWVNAPWVWAMLLTLASRHFLAGNRGTVGCTNVLLHCLKISCTANLPSSLCSNQ